MLEAIEIKNLRGVRSGRLDGLAPLTLLVGPNGSGKSTVLEAMAIAAARQPAALIGRVVSARGAYNGARYLIPHNADAAGLRLELSDRVTTTRLWHEENIALERGETIKQRASASKPEELSAICYAITHQDGEVEGRVVFDIANNYGYRSVHDLRHRPHLQFVHPAQSRTWPLWRNLRSAREQGHLEALYGLLKELLGPTFRELYTHPEGDDGDLLNVHVQFENGSVPVAVSGDGVRTLVRLALEIASEPGSCVLVEEPEVHQHPKAIWLTARALLAAARRDIQVILSTHSLELIDAIVTLGEAQGLPLKELIALMRLRLSGGELTASRLAGDTVRAMRLSIEEDLR